MTHNPAPPANPGRFTTSRHFRPTPLDVVAAVECAELTKVRLGSSRRHSRTDLAKAKFDEQIVAIARVTGASVIYSDDGGIRHLAGNLDVRGVADLPLPPEQRQGILALETAAEGDPPPPAEADVEADD